MFINLWEVQLKPDTEEKLIFWAINRVYHEKMMIMCMLRRSNLTYQYTINRKFIGHVDKGPIQNCAIKIKELKPERTWVHTIEKTGDGTTENFSFEELYFFLWHDIGMENKDFNVVHLITLLI
jgi:hypothetical protein